MFIYVEKKRLGDFKVNQLRKTPCPLVDPILCHMERCRQFQLYTHDNLSPLPPAHQIPESFEDVTVNAEKLIDP